MNISAKDKEIILQKAREIPPPFWLPASPTEDQYRHWESVKWGWSLIHDELHAYFSGQPSSLAGVLPDFLATSFSLTAKLHIDLYGVIREGWYVIKASAVSLIQDPKIIDSDKWVLQKIINAETPGHLLATVLELDCRRSFEDCLHYTEVRPRKLYDMVRNQQKVQLLKVKEELSPSEIKQVEKHNRELEGMVKPYRDKGTTLAGFCIAFCSLHLRRCKNEVLSTMVRQYQSQLDSLMLYHQSLLHPSHNVKGHTWNRGKKSSA